eukprot:6292257-Prymnesium_polylepis.1
MTSQTKRLPGLFSHLLRRPGLQPSGCRVFLCMAAVGWDAPALHHRKGGRMQLDRMSAHHAIRARARA